MWPTLLPLERKVDDVIAVPEIWRENDELRLEVSISFSLLIDLWFKSVTVSRGSL